MFLTPLMNSEPVLWEMGEARDWLQSISIFTKPSNSPSEHEWSFASKRSMHSIDACSRSQAVQPGAHLIPELPFRARARRIQTSETSLGPKVLDNYSLL